MENKVIMPWYVKARKFERLQQTLAKKLRVRSLNFSIESEESKAKWFVNLSLGKIKVRFKIDTGADVTVIPKSVYLRTGITNLKATSKVLFGPGQVKLPVKGLFKAKLMTKSSKETLFYYYYYYIPSLYRLKTCSALNKSSWYPTRTCKMQDLQDIYILENLEEALLGRPAIDALGLVQKVDIIQSDDSSIEKEVKATYPNLFKGLGELEGEFNIKLQPDSKPFVLTTPRRVALPLLKKVKEELERMEKLGVISKVDIPTDWCAGMVVVPKPDGRIRICVDLTKLNKSVLRETYPLPKIDNLLAQVGESKFFTKLDCNSGFWQKLDHDSRLLTTFITPFGRFYFNHMPFGIKSAPEHY